MVPAPIVELVPDGDVSVGEISVHAILLVKENRAREVRATITSEVTGQGLRNLEPLSSGSGRHASIQCVQRVTRGPARGPLDCGPQLQGVGSAQRVQA